VRRCVALLIVVIYLSAIVALGTIPVQPPKRVSTSSNGGSSLPDIENFIRQVESWKDNYKDRFEYLQKLLYKPAWTNTSYVPPDVWLYYPQSANKTINRTDEIKIEALIQNTNSIEIRRALFLNLEIMEPGETTFKPAKAGVKIIQVNEYDEKTETALRAFPEISSFRFLKRVGDVKLRISWTDGEYKLYSSRENISPEYGCYPELVLNVTNIPPRINNSTMKVDPVQAKWDDYIQYTGSFKEMGLAQNAGTNIVKEESPVQVTLYIYNNSQEVFNKTKPFLPEDAITFSTRDASLFKESDAGKNFTYRYSCTDGIIGGPNTTWSEVKVGPNIRPNPKIKVSDLRARCEDENYYWWQNYDFSMKAKSMSTDPVNLKVDLYTDTPNHPGKQIASRVVTVLSNNDTEVNFPNVKPFDVADANLTFSYHFGLSAPDQDGKNSIGNNGFKINSKVVPYSIYHPIMVVNLVAIFIVILIGSMLIEFKLQRGIEAQESQSKKISGNKGRSGVNLQRAISKIFKRD
jgi:hypothetical protein